MLALAANPAGALALAYTQAASAALRTGSATTLQVATAPAGSAFTTPFGLDTVATIVSVAAAIQCRTPRSPVSAAFGLAV